MFESPVAPAQGCTLCDNGDFPDWETALSQHSSPSGANIEPAWTDLPRQRQTSIPRLVLPWLKDRGSLTQRVIANCGGVFRVRLLRLAWGRPLYSEGRLLCMRHGGRALIREVELLCNGRPWVFARSLIPVTSLRGPARKLMSLGERPLGAILFADPKVRRSTTQVARLLPRHPIFSAATHNLNQQPAELWGRRTIYYMANRPLLVNEIFLPEILLKQPPGPNT